MRILQSVWPMFGLLAQSGLARLSDQMAAVVYGWGLLETSGSSAGPSLVMAASFGALVIGTLFAGRMIRRFGPRFVALAGLWTSLAAAALIAVLTAMGSIDPTVIAIIAAAGAILDGPAGIASETRYPQIARIARFDLVRLNAIDDGLDNAAGMIAPALGALVVSAFGFAAGSAMIAVLSLLAAMLCTASFPAFRTRSNSGGGVASALRHLADDRLLTSMTLLVAVIIALFVAVELVILPRALLGDDGLGARGLAAFLFSAGLSGIAGALLAVRLAKHLSLASLLSSATALLALGIALSSVGLSWTVLVASGALIGLPAGVVTPAISSLFQLRPPQHLRADLQAILGAIIFSAAPVAILAAGAAVDRIDPSTLLFCLSIAAAIAAFAARFFLPATMLQEAMHPSLNQKA
jgi:predicted MFS family arabinose efflux permease